MRILGIDPGTATVGWGVIETTGAKVLPVGFGHIATSKELSPEDRLVEIAQDLETIIRTYQPEEAGVEELFFFKNQKNGYFSRPGEGGHPLDFEAFTC